MRSILARVAVLQVVAAGLALAIGVGLTAWRGAAELPSLALSLLVVQAAVTCAAVMALHVLWRAALAERDALCAHADAIGRGDLLERTEPKLAEWAPVGRAMNVMVARLRQQAKAQEFALNELRGEVSVDALTRLPSRITFMERLRSQLDADAGARGALLLVRVVDLARINQREGRELGDELLKSVSAVLRMHGAMLRETEVFIARLNGADFGVLLRGTGQHDLPAVLEAMSSSLGKLHKQALSPLALPTIVGAALIEPGVGFADALSCADAMLRECEVAGRSWSIGAPGRVALRPSVGEWRRLIDDALDTGRVTLVRSTVAAAEGAPAHEEARIELLDAHGNALDREESQAAALRTQRIDELDLRTVELALARLLQHAMPLVVTLHAASCARPSFVRRLEIALQLAPEARARLWIEIDLRGQVQTLDDYMDVLKVLEKIAIRVGARHVPADSQLLERMRRAGVMYLRTSGRFGREPQDSVAGEGDRVFKRLAQAAGLGLVVPHADVAGSGSSAPGSSTPFLASP